MGSYTIVLLLCLVLAIYFGVRSRRIAADRDSIARERDQVAFLLESLNDGLLEYDGGMRLVRINQTGERLLGVSAPDVIGRTLTGPDLTDQSKSALVAVTFPAEAGQSTTMPAEKGRPSMTVSTQELSITYPQSRKLRIFTVPKTDGRSNTPTGFIKIVRDITQDALISQSKSDLVAVVAHQLRTPLSGIKWVFKALIDGDFGPLTGEQSKMAERGLAANEDLIHLIDDILDVSKIEAAKFDYTYADHNVPEFLNEIIDSEAESMATRRITAIREIPSAPLLAQFDKERMHMVVANIIDNAITYSKEGGTVTITLTQPTADTFRVAIKDSGIGIPDDSKARLFSKFYRAENAKRAKPRGTGLGLFLARTIITGHSGKLWVESKENVGSTFYLELPVHQTNTSTPSPAAPSEPTRVAGM